MLILRRMSIQMALWGYVRLDRGIRTRRRSRAVRFVSACWLGWRTGKLSSAARGILCRHTLRYCRRLGGRCCPRRIRRKQKTNRFDRSRGAKREGRGEALLEPTRLLLLVLRDSVCARGLSIDAERPLDEDKDSIPHFGSLSSTSSAIPHPLSHSLARVHLDTRTSTRSCIECDVSALKMWRKIRLRRPPRLLPRLSFPLRKSTLHALFSVTSASSGRELHTTVPLPHSAGRRHTTSTPCERVSCASGRKSRNFDSSCRFVQRSAPGACRRQSRASFDASQGPLLSRPPEGANTLALPATHECIPVGTTSSCTGAL